MRYSPLILKKSGHIVRLFRPPNAPMTHVHALVFAHGVNYLFLQRYKKAKENLLRTLDLI